MKHYLILGLLMLFSLSRAFGQTYCIGGPSSSADSEIAAVTLTGQTSSINYSQICPGTTGVNNQTATQSADLVVGNSYTLNVNYGTCGSNYNNAGTAYIDFDGDGIFSPSEAVGTTASSMVPFSGAYTFTVPPGAIPGTTRMRVIQWENGSTLPLDPCGTFLWGAVIDFEIILVPAGPCAGATVTAAAASSGIVCVGDSVNLSATGVSFGTGTVYQWQSSPDSVNWTNLAGPLTVNRNSGALTTTTYFRLQVTCGATTVASPGVKVEVTGTPLAGGTYTINSALATSGTNFTNFSDFTSAIFCGGVAGPVVVDVVAGSGPYVEQVLFDNINTTSTNTITINGNGEMITIGSPAGTSGLDRGLFVVNNTSFITIDNIVLKTDSGFTAGGAGLLISGLSSHIQFTNSTVEYNFASTTTLSAAVLISSVNTGSTTGASPVATNITIENNTISGGYVGISVQGASNTNKGSNNSIIGNTIEDFNVYGIYSRNQSDLLIHGNDISRPTRTSASSFYAIYFINNHDGVTASSNSIHTPFGGGRTTSVTYAFYASSANGTSGNPNYAFNNIFYNLESNGTMYAIWNATSSHWKYYHNTIDITDLNASITSTFSGTAGMYISGASDSVEFINNIVNVVRSGASWKRALFLDGSGNRTINNNGYFVDLSQPAAQFANNFNTFAAYQTGNNAGNDAASVFDIPDFASAATGSLVPAAGSMNDLGQNLLAIVPTDFLDSARTTTPDPGAFEFDPPPCPRPSVSFTSTLDTSSVLSWTSGISGGTYNIEWGPAGFTRGTGFTQTVTADSVQLTGLAPNTCYDIYVQLDCSGAGNGFSQWSFVYTWCTNCAAVVPPYFEGFENWTTGNLPDVLEDCYGYASTSTLRWQVQTGSTPAANTGPTGGAVGSSKYLFLNTSFGVSGDEAALTFPLMNLNGMTAPEVRFFYHMFGATIGTLRVEASADLGVTWDSLWSISGQQQTSSSAQYNDVAVSLGAYNTASMVLIRFVGSRAGGVTGNIAIDNISIDELPLCPSPSFPTLVSTTATDATIEWNAGGGISTAVSFGPVGFSPANGTIANTVDTFFTITGLTPQTDYEVYVQDTCTDGTVSPWIGPLALKTTCVSVPMPYFEDYSVWPNTCWTYNNDPFAWEEYTTGGVNYVQARFWSFNASNAPAVMTTVPIDITTDAQVRYNWSRNTSTAYADSLYVLSRIAGSAGWDTLKAFGDPNFGVTNAANTAPAPIADFQEETHFLPTSYIGNAVEFRFVAITDWGPNLYMDFFIVEEVPACPDPDDFTASNLSSSSVDLSWTQAGGVSNWDIEWGPQGFSPGTGTGTIVPTTSNPFTLTGLPSDSCLDIYITADCTVDSNGTSNTVGPITICTPKEFDAKLDFFQSPAAYGCGSSAMDVELVLTNLGTAAITSVPLTVEITGDITQTLNFTYTGNLTTGNSANVIVGTINAVAGGDVSMTAYAVLPNDQDLSNDSIVDYLVTFIPEEPVADDVTACAGVATVDLIANPYPGVVYEWFDVPSGGSSIHQGDTLTVTAPTSNTTYYLAYESFATSATFGYTGADIASDFDFRLPTDTSSCAGTISVNVPVGVTITGVDIAYDYEAANGAFMSEQRSELRCITTGMNEGTLAVGTGLGGILPYNRTGLTIANGITTSPQLVFELHAGRTWGGSGCDPSYNKILASSIQLTVHYQGTPCSSVRVPVEVEIGDLPTADFTSSLAGSTVTFTNTSLDFDSLYWDFAGQGNSSDPNPVFTFTTGGSQQVCLYAFNDCGIDTLCQSIASISTADLQLEQRINVYPNPSTGLFNVTFGLEGTQDVSMRVMSPSGQTILEKNLGRNAGNFQTQIDLSGFAKGIYLLQVQTQNGIATKRLNVM
ncbi:MAG: GEVED domain-containing protein [Schleiferiaceae bacterium]|nr:GEVED domain-containing protein [Schleiferiaceae bacterium]